MKKALTGILMLLALSSISQTKPDVFVTSKISDLNLIIESNEKGKIARVLVVELEKKIVVLENLGEQSKTRIANLLSIISDKYLIINNWGQVHSNDTVIIANQSAIIADLNQDKKILTRQLKRQKFKTAVTGILGIAGIVTVTYLCIQ